MISTYHQHVNIIPSSSSWLHAWNKHDATEYQKWNTTAQPNLKGGVECVSHVSKGTTRDCSRSLIDRYLGCNVANLDKSTHND